MVERVKEIYLTNGCHITKGKRESESKCFKESWKTTLSVSEWAYYWHYVFWCCRHHVSSSWYKYSKCPFWDLIRVKIQSQGSSYLIKLDVPLLMLCIFLFTILNYNNYISYQQIAHDANLIDRSSMLRYNK